jgi:hypothetical protein
MAELALIDGDGGKPRAPAADEFECEPTLLGLRGWEEDQVAERRKCIRIVKENDHAIPVAR